MQSRSSRLLLLVEPEPRWDGRSQLRVEHEAPTHRRGELVDVPLRLIDVLDHEFASALVNCRVLPGEPAAEVRDTLVRVLADERIAVIQLGEPVLSTPSALHKD